MTRLVPEPAPDVAEPLRRVLERAEQDGAPPPAWVAVADEGGAWLKHAMAALPSERAGAVAVVSTDGQLATSYELGFGGAMWMPPSTPAAVTALRSAALAAGEPTPVCDPRLVELVAGEEQLVAVTFGELAFWRRELGSAQLLGLLARLADRLGAPRVLAESPALLVAGEAEVSVRRAWEEVRQAARYAPLHDLATIPLHSDGRGPSAVAAALQAAMEEGGGRENPAMGWRPVYQIPRGDRVAGWSADHRPGSSADHVRARPGARRSNGHRWRLTDAEGSQWSVDDIASTDDVPLDPGRFVRVPARVTVTLRHGSPSALLMERLVREAERRSVTVWVSGVDDEALGLLLRLRQDLWVDGPAVPEE